MKEQKTKTLIICEKPSVAMEFARCLNLFENRDGFKSSAEYVVTWCVGHLCTLKDPKDYNEEWEKWDYNLLPLIPKRYEIKCVDQTKKQFNVVKKLLNSKEFLRVINACDAGREGELIFQNVYTLSGSSLPIYRMWTSAAITNETIKRELSNLKPMAAFQGLANAAKARACADWAVGINGTRALTLSANIYKEVISVGRVQTPCLSFLVTRELEIQNFKSKNFYQIKSNFSKDGFIFNGVLEYKADDEVKSKFENESEAQKILAQIKDIQKAYVDKITETTKKISPPNLFSLTELQKEANKIFSYSAQKTLETCQSLYEKHKMISYPRTDSSYLPNDLTNVIEKILKFINEYNSNFEQEINFILNQNQFKKNKRVFDDSKVSDHHALIPTGIKSNISLNENEQKIFELIYKRFVSSFLDDYIELNKKISIIVGKFEFKSVGKTPIKMGWHDVYCHSNEDESSKKEISDTQSLPALCEHEQIKIEKIFLDAGRTKPPARYTEATLLAAMESPAKFLNNDKVDEKEILKQKGIGTPATRASIIDSLIERKYCERKSKSLTPTRKAISLIQNLKPESLKSPLMTAEWEQKLMLIEKNEYSLADFAKELNEFVKGIVVSAPEAGKNIRVSYERERKSK